MTVGTLLLAGCASSGQRDPPASAPNVPSSPTRSQLASSPSPVASASGDGAAEGRGETPERERSGAQHVTLKNFKSAAWSTKAGAEETKTVAEDKGGEPVRPAVVSGAIAATGAVRESREFAERRASEGLDRLAGSITVRHEKRGAVITLANDRLVDAGESKLTPSGQYGLRELARGLREQDGHLIRIQGYTDSMGTPAVNEALSLRRAEAVRDFLIAQGVPAESLRAEGFGAKRPVGHNTTAEGRAANRRIEIVISPLE